MNYSETLEFLYSRLPAFQKQGSSAVNWKLEKIQQICAYLGNPQDSYKTIHVAGTNGKGSSSHYLASIFQEAGYKTGLYTSPHLKDFRERFKVNGALGDKAYVIDFVEKHQKVINELAPSFFELTVAMSFQYFAEQKVEWAIIEVGLGGRLDSTNIIKPKICLITNIGLDHQDMLGDTLQEIAGEKAGIIKEGVPVVISEYQKEIANVFSDKAELLNSPLRFSKDIFTSREAITNNLVTPNSILNNLIKINPLKGAYQQKNLQGVLAIILELKARSFAKIPILAIEKGVANLIANTNLKGRWQILANEPLTISDTGHNQEAFTYLLEYLNRTNKERKFLVLGFARDKNVAFLLKNLPTDCIVYFTSFNSQRSISEKEFQQNANLFNIQYRYFANVNLALEKARIEANKEDLIFIGGSTYLVAEINDL